MALAKRGRGPTPKQPGELSAMFSRYQTAVTRPTSTTVSAQQLLFEERKLTEVAALIP